MTHWPFKPSETGQHLTDSNKEKTDSLIQQLQLQHFNKETVPGHAKRISRIISLMTFEEANTKGRVVIVQRKNAH